MDIVGDLLQRFNGPSAIESEMARADTDYENVEARWRLAYQIAEQRYNLIQGMIGDHPSLLSDPITYNRIYSLFIHSELYSGDLHDRLATTQDFVEENVIDLFIADEVSYLEELADQEDPYSANTLHMANHMVNALAHGMSFEQAVMQIDWDAHMNELNSVIFFFDSYTMHDPDQNVIALEPEEDRRRLRLHIQRSDVEPFAQMTRTMNDIAALRSDAQTKAATYSLQSGFGYQHPIVGLSHLFDSRMFLNKRGEFKYNGMFYNAMGEGSQVYVLRTHDYRHAVYKIEMGNGVEVRLFDVPGWLDGTTRYEARSEHYLASYQDALRTSLHNLILSERHMESYILNGTLPEVGAVIIPAETFWLV
ncbi:hypothetical protein KC909_03475 [Candidatus Dojkabacteria bacterium]|uniref:Uncharacterized protein n=1 Tax=Candidatus Dojkabacteria bacterium TaxID=2099670 RepID=A0A955RJF5_9BACT|nr:hypothetical protein [Candidatus Dojkabacteria bacterium]